MGEEFWLGKVLPSRLIRTELLKQAMSIFVAFVGSDPQGTETVIVL